MVPSKTYLKFKETRSQEDLDTLNKYLKRLSEISSKLNDDAIELSNEEESKLYDEDEDLTDKVLRLLFGDTFFIFISEYNLRTHILQSLENLEELLEQEDINLRTLRIKELEISFTVTRRTKSEYLKSLDFWYNPLTNYKEYQIPLQK